MALIVAHLRRVDGCMVEDKKTFQVCWLVEADEVHRMGNCCSSKRKVKYVGV